MTWRSWLGAGVIWSCMQHAPSRGAGCLETGDLAGGDVLVVQACLVAAEFELATTAELCEQAWQATGSEAAAVAGARHALCTDDGESLKRWAGRALPTTEGARILHFLGELQQRHGDLVGAELSLRSALTLRLDRDPARAANTALLLLALLHNSQPAADSIRLARLAWEQAELSHDELIRANAAISLVEILIDLGELSTASAVIDRMDASKLPRWRAVRGFARARLEAAHGRTSLAIALFQQASQIDPTIQGGRRGLPYDALELVEALLGAGRLDEARRELDRARTLIGHNVVCSHDIDARFAAAEAAVELAESDSAAALASVERGLAIEARDAARLRLLNVRGDVLARRGDAIAAERAWREAADSVETWRASIPTIQLRSGLIGHHRRALESWLESTGQRGDAAGALEVTQRILGRELLDRLYQREAGARVTADASIREIEDRLKNRHELGRTMAGARRRDLRDATQDMVAIMFGSRSVWAIRHGHGRWSIDRVGDRAAVLDWVDAYRRNIDDPSIAARLGNALFPQATLPAAEAPLAVMLDREIADVALAGLRVGDAYLVERVAILESLAPDLLFAAVPERPWQPAIGIADPRGDLTEARSEVDAMASETGAAVHLGDEATRAALAAGAGAFVLHVATHSRIEDGRAEFVLSDSALSSNEIVDRKIAPRLAVIATCRSQVNDDPATSLVAAFLAAGSPAVIGVKRALGDQDGAALMRRFYHLHGATDPLRALASAQRAAIAAGQSPSAWAAVSFFGVGGWIEH